MSFRHMNESKGESAETDEEQVAEEAKTEEAKTQTAEDTASEDSKKEEENKEEEKARIYYVTDEVQQSQYINMFKAQGQDAIVLTHNIDSSFITYLEQKHQDVQFL